MNTDLWFNPELYPFENKFVDLNGQSVHYIDEGEGIPVLFLHPAVGWSFMYRNFISELSKNFRCIALDFPGFGLSPQAVNEEYTVENQSKIVDLFIKKLGLENIILIGHDTGGPSGFIVAARNPNKFKGIVLTDTICFPVSDYKYLKTMLKFVSGNLFRNLNKNYNLLLKATYRFGIRKKKLSSDEKSAYLDLFDTPEKRDRIIDILGSLLDADKILNEIRDGFNSNLIDHPVLMIYGQYDPVKLLGVPKRLSKILHRPENHIVKGEAHFPHESAFLEMSSIINKWISSL